MQVLLNLDVQKLGYKGDIVSVKDGYFRNYLLPRGLAVLATNEVKKLSEKRKEKLVLRKQQLLDNAKEVLAKLKGLSVTIKAKVSSKGKLYASITESDVIKAVLEAANVQLEKEFLKMDHMKETGKYQMTVRLGEGMEEKIKVNVQKAK